MWLWVSYAFLHTIPISNSVLFRAQDLESLISDYRVTDRISPLGKAQVKGVDTGSEGSLI